MKFESLKSKKFEDFISNEIINTINFLGGTCGYTKKKGEKEWTDRWDDSTGNDVHCTDGTSYDYGCQTPTPTP